MLLSHYAYCSPVRAHMTDRTRVKDEITMLMSRSMDETIQAPAIQTASETGGSALHGAKETVIRFSKVNKNYGAFHALKNIDLNIHQGEIVVVCGPSGSGKSTLIRCINGLEAIDSGSLSVLDHEVTQSAAQLRKIRREVGMVFQSFNLYPHLNAVENITLALRYVKRIGRT